MAANKLRVTTYDKTYMNSTHYILPTASLQVGQFIAPGKSKESDLFTAFLFNHFQLLVIMISGYLSIAVLAFMFPKLIRRHFNRLKSLKLLIFELPVVHPSRLPRFVPNFALIWLFLNGFFLLFFNGNFLLGSIQTDHTVVDTSEIIDSSYKLTNTPKTLIILLDDQKTLSQSPRRSLLRKISEKKAFVLGAKVTEKEMSLVTQGKMLENYFFFHSYTHLLFILSVAAPFASSANLVAFTPFQSYYEICTAFYMRSSLDEQRKRFIHQW